MRFIGKFIHPKNFDGFQSHNDIENRINRKQTEWSTPAVNIDTDTDWSAVVILQQFLYQFISIQFSFSRLFAYNILDVPFHSLCGKQTYGNVTISKKLSCHPFVEQKGWTFIVAVFSYIHISPDNIRIERISHSLKINWIFTP